LIEADQVGTKTTSWTPTILQSDCRFFVICKNNISSLREIIVTAFLEVS
jgi:hypothetical protein